jgi:hypothetical protein
MPRLTTRVELHNPGPVTVSPETGNPVAGDPVVTSVRAYVAQRPVANLASAIEMRGVQDTVVGLFTLLVPPGSPLYSDTTVVDADGRRYVVEGEPADRRNTRSRGVVYRAVALRLISDLQGDG